MRKFLAALTLVGVTLAGCGTPAPRSDPSTAVARMKVTVDIPPAECLPQGVPGNCWLPAYGAPVVSGNAVNRDDKQCNNQSQDQRACWPQQGTQLTANCLALGMDGRIWFGIQIPLEAVRDGHIDEVERDHGYEQGYVAATYVRMETTQIDELGGLRTCNQPG